MSLSKYIYQYTYTVYVVSSTVIEMPVASDTPNLTFDKPQAKSQSQSLSNPKGKEEFGLWAVTKIL